MAADRDPSRKSRLMPMFPLQKPCLPGEVLVLRVFETRYVHMMDRLSKMDEPEFGTVLIDRGSEVGGGDIRRSVGTSMSVIRIEDVDSIHLSVVAVGRRRIQVIEWLRDDPHPWAIVEDLPDEPEDEVEIESSETSPIMTLLRAQPLGDLSQQDALYSLALGLHVGPLDLQRILEARSSSERVRIMDEVLQHIRELRRFESFGRD